MGQMAVKAVKARMQQSVTGKVTSPSHAQSGFTLIELLVVLAIVGIIASVGVISLNTNEQAHARSISAKLQGAIQSSYDVASFRQRLVLLVPETTSENFTLSAYEWIDQQWLRSESLQPLLLEDEAELSWQTENLVNPFLKLPAAGWLFWPSGEVSSGWIQWQINEEAQPYRLSWDESMQFDYGIEQP
jgi:type II secretion system protein H